MLTSCRSQFESFQSENTHLGFHLEKTFLELHKIGDNTGNVDSYAPNRYIKKVPVISFISSYKEDKHHS